MLGILIIILALSVTLTVKQGLENHSYFLALMAGAVAAAVILLLRKTQIYNKIQENLNKLGKVKCAAAVTALCFAFGLIWNITIRLEPFSDYQTYWDCAVALATGGEIYSTEYVAMYPHILGYSSFLSLFIRLFGQHVMVGVIVNLVLSCLTGLLIFLIIAEPFGVTAASFGGGLWAVYPGRIMLGSLIFSEPLYTCLVLLMLYLLMLLQKHQNKLKESIIYPILWGLGLGLLLEAINAVRPISAILIIALLLWLVLLRGRELKSGKLWRMWLLVLVPMLLCFQFSGKLWDRHLEAVLGEEVAGLPIYNMYVGFNMDTLGQWSADDMDLLFEYRREPGGSAPAAQQSMLPHVLERLQADNLNLPKLFSSKLFVFLGNDELGGYTYRFTRSESFVKICMVLCNCAYYLLLLLALAGIIKLWQSRKNTAVLMLPLYTLGLTLAHMLIEVSSRYHYSLIPIFIIFAAMNLGDKGEQL
jgi:hypothetical protein